MNASIWRITMCSIGCGIAGTLLGGAMIGLLPKFGQKLVGMLFQYTAGLMLVIICFGLLPQAFILHSFPSVFFTLLLGIVLTVLLQDILQYDVPPRHNIDKTRGYMICAAVAMYSLPEGLAIGSGFTVSAKIGITLLMTVILQYIPFGMTIATPFRSAGRPIVGITLSLLCTLPLALGCYLGAWVGNVSVRFMAMILSLAAGCMLYVSIGELIPSSHYMYHGRMGIFAQVVGILSGLLVIFSI